jgi:hypothetical protein
MELDHLFIRSPAGAPAGALLQAFGLTEGSGNVHPGQGTANRRFFIPNAFIELLWIADAVEVRSASTRPTQLAQRLSGDDAQVSPFGVCFRPSANACDIPFPCWDYRPGYLPEGMTISMGKEACLSEPLWFFLAAGCAPEPAPADRRQPLTHACGLRVISSITISGPGLGKLSQAATAATATGQVKLVESEQHLMVIAFDNEATGRSTDFRPELPLIFTF